MPANRQPESADREPSAGVRTPVTWITTAARTELALGLALLLAVVVPSLDTGGFGNGSRSLLIVLAGLALLVATAIDAPGAARIAGSPLALVLFALATLAVVSAAWTIGSVADTVRWGLVIGGYGAIVVTAGTLSNRVGGVPIAAGIGVLAALEALLGLRAVAMHALPDAERIVGAWRPGGTFEYPPALALLELGALPIYAAALGRRPRALAFASATATVLSGAVLALADSRLTLGMAVAFTAVAVLRPGGGDELRRRVLGASLLALVGVACGAAILGGAAGANASAPGVAGMIELLLLALVAAGVSVAVLSRMTRIAPRLASGACLAVLALSVVLIALASDDTPLQTPTAASHRAAHVGTSVGTGSGLGASGSDFLHGRGHELAAAFETWMDRPLLGSGADTYYQASVAHQTAARSRYAHDLPLELGAELGVLGLVLGLALYAVTGQLLVRAARARAFWLLAPLTGAFLVSNLLDWPWHLAGLGAAWAVAGGALCPFARGAS